jgi:tetratricopeptide (TPR) repeat protein
MQMIARKKENPVTSTADQEKIGMKRRGSTSYALAGMVAVITFLVYLPALRNAFVGVWDDNAYVADNIHIRSFDQTFLRWAFSTMQMGNWNPLTWISHAIDYAIWGLNPAGHHLTSIVIHAVNAGLVVLLILELLESARGRPDDLNSCLTDRTVLLAAGVTGLLFGIHPLHVESVAWVAERKDLLCALFFLLSVLSYATFVSHRTYKIYFLAFCFFVLALMSKPMAVSLPAVLLILDWYPFGRIRSLKTFWQSVVEKTPFLALSLIFSLLSIIAQRSGGALSSTDKIPLSVRALVAPHSLIAYLGKMLLPLNLVPLYPYPHTVSLFSFPYGVPILLTIGITLTSLALAKKQKIWAAAWTYYVLTLAPVLGIVQIGSQAMADRYTYLPSLGPFLIGGLCSAWMVGRIKRYAKRSALILSVAAFVVISVFLVLSGSTIQQIGIWKNGFTLWDRTITEGFAGATAYNNRGLSLEEAGEWSRASEDFEHAILLDPANYFAYNNRGVIYGKEGQFQRSVEYFLKAIAINPRHADAYCNLGLSYFNLHQFKSALDSYDKAIALKPDFDAAYLDRGNLHVMAGERQLAVADYQEACGLGNRNACEALRLATEDLISR